MVDRFVDTTMLMSSKLSSPLSLDVYTSQSLATGIIVPYRVTVLEGKSLYCISNSSLQRMPILNLFVYLQRKAVKCQMVTLPLFHYIRFLFPFKTALFLHTSSFLLYFSPLVAPLSCLSLLQMLCSICGEGG